MTVFTYLEFFACLSVCELVSNTLQNGWMDFNGSFIKYNRYFNLNFRVYFLSISWRYLYIILINRNGARASRRWFIKFRIVQLVGIRLRAALLLTCYWCGWALKIEGNISIRRIGIDTRTWPTYTNPVNFIFIKLGFNQQRIGLSPRCYCKNNESRDKTFCIYRIHSLNYFVMDSWYSSVTHNHNFW